MAFQSLDSKELIEFITAFISKQSCMCWISCQERKPTIVFKYNEIFMSTHLMIDDIDTTLSFVGKQVTFINFDLKISYHYFEP